MRELIEIIPIGPGGALFQIANGTHFGLLDMEGDRASWDATRHGILARSEVLEVLGEWLEREGVLVGSPHPSRILWTEVVHRMTRAA